MEIEEEESLELIVDPDANKVDNLKSVCESFAEIPPELSELANDNQSLFAIANYIHDILGGAEDMKFTPKSREILEFALRTFIFNSKPKEQKDTAKDREESNQIRELSQQLAEAKEETRICEEKISKLTKENQSFKEKLEQSQQDGKEYFTRLSQSDEKLTKIRRENAAKQKELKQEIDQINEEKQNIIGKLKIAEFTVQRLNKSLDLANQENAKISAELVSIKSKSEAKSQKLKAATDSVATMQLKIQELDADNQRLLTDQNDLIQQIKDCQDRLVEAGPENVKNLEGERDAYKETVVNLQKDLDEKTANYVAARREQTELTKKLGQKEQELVENKENAAKVEEENNMLKQEVQALNNQVEMLNQQVEKYKKQEESVRNGSIFFESINYNDKNKTEIGLENLPEDKITAIRSIIDGTSNDELLEQNKRLICIIENELRFLSSAVVRNLFDPKLLSPDAVSKPLSEDQCIIDNMFVEMARTRQFIQTECKENQEKMPEESIKSVINGLQNADNIQQREALSLIAILSANNDAVRRFCDKILSQNQFIVSQLSSAFDSANKTTIEEMIPEVVKQLKLVKQFTKRVQLILKGEFDSSDTEESFEFVTKYCQGTSTILRDFDTELRNAVQFEGELEELPAFACQCVNELKEMIIKEKNESIQGTRNQIAQLRREIAAEQEKSAEQISKLEKTIEQLENEKEILQKNNTELEAEKNETQAKLSATEDEKQIADEKLQAMLKNYGQLEEDLEVAKQENEEMRQQMNKKQATFEERIDAIISDERKQHVEDLLRFEEKLKEREERLQLEINTKSQKLTKTKQKLKMVIETYEKAFKQQKETTAQLRQQNNELIDRLQIPPEKKGAKVSQGPGTAEAENLKAQIRNLKQEKAILATQLEETEAKVAAEQAAQNKAWEEKIKAKEQEIEEVKKQEEEKREYNESQLISEIAESLAPYAADCSDTESAVRAVREVAQSLAQAEKNIEKLKRNNAIKEVPNVNNSERAQQVNNALQDWDRWARDLYVNVTDGQIPKQSSKDLRYALSEMVLSSIGHRKLIWRLESLRSQKKALTSGVEIPERSTPPPSSRATVLSVIGAIRILRKAGRFQSVFN